LFVGGLMFYLRYFCLFAYSDAQYILCCVFVLFFFVLCTLCSQFLRIVHFWLPLRYSLTFILTRANRRVPLVKQEPLTDPSGAHQITPVFVGFVLRKREWHSLNTRVVNLILHAKSLCYYYIFQDSLVWHSRITWISKVK
jgi:hypothetical protein